MQGEQPLWGMELQEKKTQKTLQETENLLRKKNHAIYQNNE